MSDRSKWPTDRKAYEQSARILHKAYPESGTFAAQVQVLDELAQVTERVSQLMRELEHQHGIVKENVRLRQVLGRVYRELMAPHQGAGQFWIETETIQAIVDALGDVARQDKQGSEVRESGSGSSGQYSQGLRPTAEPTLQSQQVSYPAGYMAIRTLDDIACGRMLMGDELDEQRVSDTVITTLRAIAGMCQMGCACPLHADYGAPSAGTQHVPAEEKKS